ncbi:MEKHLA domain-containing protein [Rubritalea sp.]|uniref:MEKHLA domain-containing protein n=1 Tax=Rubritalea sp. TaxID=2109375 RepID=UPI003EFA42B8
MPSPLAPPYENALYQAHAVLLCESFERFLKRPLVTSHSQLPALLDAPFVLLSHGIEEDPIFNFGNHAALSLFELSWEQLTALPSRKSAEPINREERKALLDQVTTYGFIDNYSGIRISSSGKKFLIKDAVVWNLIDSSGGYHGQAAVFEDWSYL